VRYNDGAIATLDDLNTQLVLATLFSDPLLINDGYILSHPAIRMALLNSDRSPLRHLVECGYVKLLTRNDGDLGGLAGWMADVGITSAKLLLQNEAFQNTYQPFLAKWTKELKLPAYDPFRDWPNIRLDEIYKVVSQDALRELTASGTVNAKECTGFETQLKDSKERRTEWEDIAVAMRDTGAIGPDTFCSLMKAANEAYQYSWGCALTKDIGPVRVLTRLPQHLVKLGLTELTIPESPKKPIQLSIPDAAFAIKAVGNQWDKLAEVVTVGKDLNVLKYKFLDALRQYYASDTTDDQLVKQCAQQYTVALSKHFGHATGVNVLFDLTFVGVSTAAGGLIAGPLGMITGAALSVTGVAASHLGAPKLLWRLSALSPKKWLVDRNILAPADLISAFQIDSETASRYTRGVHRFVNSPRRAQ
jgi:hypothetical protein